MIRSTSIRGVARTGSFGRIDSLRGGPPSSNPPSRSSIFGRGDKLPPSLSSRPQPTAVATLPRDAERRSRSSGEYVTVLEIGSGAGSVVGTEVRSRTVPRTRTSGYERSAANSSRPVSRSNSQGRRQQNNTYILLLLPV